MAKSIEIGFVIGAALAGGFMSSFNTASKAVGDFQNKTANLQIAAGQVSAYQKMRNAISQDMVAMVKAKNDAKSLEVQIASSKQRTAELSSQYKDSQSKISGLNAELIRNKDAYKLAQLNAGNLEQQIKNSKGSATELLQQYELAQTEVRRLEENTKQSAVSLKAEQTAAQRLKAELKNSRADTKSLSQEAKRLKDNADRLQTGLGKNKETLAQLSSELKNSGINVKNLASEQERLTQQSQKAADAQTRLQNAQARYAAAREKLSWNNIKGGLISSAAMGYSLYKPLKEAADFEAAMARVNAVAFTGLGKSKEQKAFDAEEFKKLQEQARQLGRETQYTASQAANTQEVLARAGFKSNEIISAMPGLLSMAAAEGMDLSQAADIAASSLRGFKLNADQMNRVADVLAQTSAASNTSIAGLGESMKMVAPVAASLGVSIEQTAAMLGVMANNGIKGTESGTALRNAFLRLSQEPKAVAKALSKMGIASRTAQGNMRELPDIMLALSKKMKDMGEADRLKNLADIFGVRAASGMLAVMQGVIDNSLQTLEQQNKQPTGIFIPLSKAVNNGNENAKVSVEDFRIAMKNAEAPARKLGISYRDLSIYTAILAKNSIKGAEADKKLVATFTQLIKKPRELQKNLKKYNITALNKDGTFRDFPDFLRDINNAMAGMKEPEQLKALTKIFGNEEAAKTILTLSKNLPQAFSEYDKAIKGSKGVSYEMMQKQLETFNGQWEIAKSAASDFMIEIGKDLLPGATNLVKAFSSITASITEIMQKYPEVTKLVVQSLEIIAAFKVTKTIGGIVKTVGDLSVAWLDVKNAAKAAADVAGTLAPAVAGSAGKVSYLKDLIMALTGPLGLVAAAVALIALNWEDVCKWCEKAGEAITKIDRTTPMSELKRDSPDYGIRAMESVYAIPELKPHAIGGIFSSPHLGLVAEAGREAVIPLEDKSRGIPLWKAAGEELGYSFGNTTNNNTRNNTVSMSPVFNFTINNADNSVSSGLEARLRDIVSQCLTNLQNDYERLSFA